MPPHVRQREFFTVGETADFGGPFALINQINQSGLSAGYTPGVTGFDAFVAGTTHDGANALNSGFSVGPFGRFTYDLGGLVAINGIGLWKTQNSGSVLSFDLMTRPRAGARRQPSRATHASAA